MLIQAAQVIAILLVVIVLLFLIRKTLLPKFKIFGGIALVTVSVVVGTLVLSQTGIQVLSASPVAVLLLSFIGVLFSQAQPLSKQALCRGLALVSGITALAAAWNAEYLATAASLGVTGLLVQLAELDSTLPNPDANDV
jgi:hypothetical protein